MSKLQEYLEMADTLVSKKLDNGVEIDMLGQGDLFSWNQDVDIKRLKAAVKANDEDDQISDDDSLGVKILKFIKQTPRRYSEIQRFIGEQVGDTSNNRSMGTHALSRLLPLHCKKVDGKWTLRDSIIPTQPYAKKHWQKIGFKDWESYRFAWMSNNRMEARKKIEHEKTMGTFDENEAKREKWRKEFESRNIHKGNTIV